MKPGSHFVVVADRDVVIPRSNEAPSADQFDTLIRKARQQAKAEGMKRSDVKAGVLLYFPMSRMAFPEPR